LSAAETSSTTLTTVLPAPKPLESVKSADGSQQSAATERVVFRVFPDPDPQARDPRASRPDFSRN
jgi:hypothetical protein